VVDGIRRHWGGFKAHIARHKHIYIPVFIGLGVGLAVALALTGVGLLAFVPAFAGAAAAIPFFGSLINLAIGLGQIVGITSAVGAFAFAAAAVGTAFTAAVTALAAGISGLAYWVGRSNKPADDPAAEPGRTAAVPATGAPVTHHAPRTALAPAVPTATTAPSTAPAPTTGATRASAAVAAAVPVELIPTALMEDLSRRADELERDAKGAREEIIRLEAKLVSAKTKKTELRQEIARLQHELTGAQLAITAAQHVTNESIRQQAVIMSGSESGRLICQQQTQLTVAHQGARESERRIEQMQADLEEARAQVTKLEGAAAKTEQLLATLRSTAQVARTDLEQAHVAVDKREADVERLQAELQSLRLSLSEHSHPGATMPASTDSPRLSHEDGDMMRETHYDADGGGQGLLPPALPQQSLPQQPHSPPFIGAASTHTSPMHAFTTTTVTSACATGLAAAASVPPPSHTHSTSGGGGGIAPHGGSTTMLFHTRPLLRVGPPVHTTTRGGPAEGGNTPLSQSLTTDPARVSRPPRV
jgi:peptidoglycan hydrolase CwlO-like protein